jgi:TetR/AcrR family transcriptional regulator
MTKTTRNKANREAIKEKILNAAITEFSLHGFNGASTQGIADRAGMKKSQLHYYIEDKESLYFQVLDKIFSSWDALFEYNPQMGGTPADTLSEYVQMKLDFALTYPELSRIFTMEVISGGPHLDRFWHKAMHSALLKADIINTWVQENKIRALDGRLLLMNIWALTQYYADYALQAEQLLKSQITTPDTKARIQHELITFVLTGCGLPPDEAHQPIDYSINS